MTGVQGMPGGEAVPQADQAGVRSPAQRAGRGWEMAETQKPPIFVLGSQRSGTTMLRLMLNNHSRIAIPHESGFITSLFHKLDRFGDLSERGAVERLLEAVAKNPHVARGKLIVDREDVLARPIADYRDFVAAVFQSYAEHTGKPRWGDKTPSYTEEIDVIRRIFPDAKILHIVRDGRDVVVSHKGLSWASGNYLKLVADWRWKVTIAHKVGSVLGDDFLELRYEDLVRQPEATLRRICDFVGEAYEPEMLNYSETAGDVVPSESLVWHRNSIRPPDPSQLDKWKTALSKAERILFEEIAGDALELFGYERENRAPTLSSRLLKAYYTLIKRY